MKIGLTSYLAISLATMAALVLYAAHTKEQFYPTILFLVNSKVSIIISLNLVVCFTLTIGNAFKSIFLGQLRQVEVEMLVDRLKYYIIETSLALTIFRHDLSMIVFLQFLLLLFLKSFHWLTKARLEYLEQILPIPLSLHVRQVSLMSLLLVADLALGYYCLDHTMKHGKSVIILFGFEMGLLVLSICNVIARYIIQIADNNLENGLPSKGLHIMVLDVVTDALIFVTYCSFFALVFSYYGIPLHIIRECWVAFAVFYKRLTSLVKYLNLLSNIEKRFPDATPEELAAAGDCLVCREGFSPDSKGKRLPCSHVFHLDCLRVWLQHQQACPLCRADIPASAEAPRVGEGEANPSAEEARTGGTADLTAEAAGQSEDRAEDASSSSAEEPLPCFYCCLVDSPVLPVMELTHGLATRVLKRGAVVFVTQQARSADGTTWLQLSDGFVAESIPIPDSPALVLMQKYAPPSKPLSTPRHLEELRSLVPRTVSAPSSKSARNKNPAAAAPPLSASAEPSASVAEPGSATPSPAKSASRMDTIRELSAGLRDMTSTVGALQRQMQSMQARIQALENAEGEDAWEDVVE